MEGNRQNFGKKEKEENRNNEKLKWSRAENGRGNRKGIQESLGESL